jgi:nicotinamide mononucleotide transporter
MALFLGTIWIQLSSWSVSEMVAVVFAILYFLLAIRENIWCWFFAGVSTAIYVTVYFDAKLYMESALNVFYFAMAIYGWFIWRSGGEQHLPVVTWPARTHLLAVTAIAVCVAIIGYLLDTLTDAAFPYIDSVTTFAAIWATFLITRKVLENWWYWLVIDIVSIFIYWSRELELTSVLFVAYVVMIPFGLFKWSRSLREQQQPPAT